MIVSVPHTVMSVPQVARSPEGASAPVEVASVMMGSTETTFYTVAVYFGAVGIKNTRHTLTAALSADITGIILSAIVARALIL